MRRIYRVSWVLAVALALSLSSSALAGFAPLTPAAAPASHVMPNFPLTGQWWNLSCEYAATSAATKFFSKTIGQDTFVNAIGYDANPHKGFRGNISGPWGGTWDYGVYAQPILAVLLKSGFSHSYVFRADANLLRDAVSNDRPVVVWINGTYGNAPRYQIDDEGEQFVLVPYEHAVTVYGYNESGVMVMDPAYPAYYEVDWKTFLSAWAQLDGMALAVAV